MHTFRELLLLSALLLSGCFAGLGDWERKLVGDYEIWRISGHDLELVKRTSEHSSVTIVGPEVYAVSWTKDVIFLQQEPMPPLQERNPKEPHGELRYYIFLVQGEELLGPFDEKGFAAACAEQGLAQPESWTVAKDLDLG